MMKNHRECNYAPDGSSGSVLVLAIWAILLLSMLALAVGAHVSANVDMADTLARRVAAASAARAGVAASLAGLAGDTNEWDSPLEGWGEDPSRFEDVAVGVGRYRVTHENLLASGLVVTNCGLKDEESKININSVTNPAGFEMVRSLLQYAGKLEGRDALGVAACLADWLDENDEAREEGAESAYYRNLAGYACRNGRIAFLEELLLVKGVDRQLFSRIRKHVTIHGHDASVNLNTAGHTVLASVAGALRGGDQNVCDSLARRILEFRESGGQFKEQRKREIREALFGAGRIGDAGRAEWRALEWGINHGLFGIRSRHFGGVSTGIDSRGSGVVRRIEFVYDRRDGEIRAWNEY